VGQGGRSTGSTCDATLELGDVTIVSLCDVEAPFPGRLDEVFPRPPRTGWPGPRAPPRRVRRRSLAPSRACVRQVTIGGHTILVDAGSARPVRPAAGSGEVRCPRDGRGGIDLDRIDIVVLTHLHLDHVGWATRASSGEPEARFPKATYLLQAADAERSGSSSYHWAIEPLLRAGRLQTVDGDREIVEGARLVSTPGHTAGSQSLLVETDVGGVLLWGDVANHPVQVEEPEFCSVGDEDPSRIVTTRRRWIREAEAGWWVAPSHFPSRSTPGRPPRWSRVEPGRPPRRGSGVRSHLRGGFTVIHDVADLPPVSTYR
jgi:glyoxylase-like metal-dependent hydrolase (beta-lactamase superfamily II)